MVCRVNKIGLQLAHLSRKTKEPQRSAINFPTWPAPFQNGTSENHYLLLLFFYFFTIFILSICCRSQRSSRELISSLFWCNWPRNRAEIKGVVSATSWGPQINSSGQVLYFPQPFNFRDQSTFLFHAIFFFLPRRWQTQVFDLCFQLELANTGQQTNFRQTDHAKHCDHWCDLQLVLLVVLTLGARRTVTGCWLSLVWDSSLTLAASILDVYFHFTFHFFRRRPVNYNQRMRYNGLDCCRANQKVRYNGLDCRRANQRVYYNGLDCPRTSQSVYYNGLDYSTANQRVRYNGLDCSRANQIMEYCKTILILLTILTC